MVYVEEKKSKMVITWEAFDEKLWNFGKLIGCVV